MSMPVSTPVYPRELSDREAGAVRGRRDALGLPASDPSVGLALSGGGIRSATFSLGFVQALARRDLLPKVDFLSTVSGGGYLGGFLGGLYVGRGAPAVDAPATTEAVKKALTDPASPVVGWLRENGRYIAPTGSGDYLYAASIYLRNWLSVHFVIALALLTLFLGADLARGWLWHVPAWVRLEELALVSASSGVWASPWLALPLAVLAFALVPIGCSYWLVQGTQRLTWTTFVGTALVMLVGLYLARYAAGETVRMAGLYLVVGGGESLVSWALARGVGGAVPGVMRNLLSSWLSAWLTAFLALLALAVVDSLAQTAYRLIAHSGLLGAWSMMAAVLPPIIAALAHLLAPMLGTRGGKGLPAWLPADALMTLASLVFAVITLTIWATVAQAVLWGGEPAMLPRSIPGPVLIGFVLCLAITLLNGWTISFLNLSSLAQFYAARLTRAYLGASNPTRTRYAPVAPAAPETRPTDRNVTRANPGDDLEWSAYHPERHGGPLHLVNVTLNETVSGLSQLEQRDRKGLPMALGPFGVSVGREHHALWDEPQSGLIRPLEMDGLGYAVFEPGADGKLASEQPPLKVGQWVAVSGAAFTTGLGTGTSLGKSLLLGLSNVRLGYWWDSGVNPRTRPGRMRHGLAEQTAELLSRTLPTQSYLWCELLARFYGPNRQRWYLSDGGHFENTAVYELLRRRVELIIACDNGQDSGYTLEDLANLVRKARIDFCAEVRFLTEDELDSAVGQDSALRRVIGTPFQLQQSVENAASGRYRDAAYSSCHATVARVYYDEAAVHGSTLLVVKPSLTGDEPIDLHQYHSAHPAFPQESTLDQFFDEAQWESYRRLGEHIGERLFSPAPAAGKWAPGEMKPL